ncbi:uncharacterized protein PV09_05453 [Verruconis gallopava]|uniref:Transcription factor CBF/NF-Y/archaeal histone domain-containing protein n=1 Tax=Verruconis gallopava TaxID=253628 RepID=A0A0D1XLD6_9PEZI|nr:uncharacterized protein PV09_05453 [Verruconis gallopava]KIW03231.1 hypothetical protein PV09_05453 [Verruconis gallopava]
MPYNNTPIAPPKEYTGSVSLPLARVKKIIHADDDIQSCSNNAAFVITIATEMFIQHLVERTFEIIKAEKRPRRNVQYGDVANAVARLDNLEFLSDVVPRTTTFAKYTERRKKQAEAEARAAAEPPREHRSPIQQFANSPSATGPSVPGHARAPSGGAPAPYTNGSHHSPSNSFHGPGGRSVNLLDDDDAMEVDHSTGRTAHPPVPTTMELLERARAAQARAESGLSHSPSLPPGGS